MTQKSKQQQVCSVFPHHLYSHRGVFIAQRLTYPLAKIPIMPPNCPKYRIFRGLLGNIKSAHTQWITAGPTCGSLSWARSFAAGRLRPGLRIWTFTERVCHSSAKFPSVLVPSLRTLRDCAGRRLTAAMGGGSFIEDTSLRGLRLGAFTSVPLL